MALDAGDPLAYLRDGFLVPAGTLRLDSDRLGPLTREVKARLASFMHVEWGAGFSDGGGLAGAAAEKLAPLLGAPPEQLGFAATADDALEALADAASAAGRNRVVAAPGEFPALLAGSPQRAAPSGRRRPEPGATAARCCWRAASTPRGARSATSPRLPGRRARPARSPPSTSRKPRGSCRRRSSARAWRRRSGGAAASSAADPAPPAWVHAAGPFAGALEAMPPPSALALAALDGALDRLAGADIEALGWKARTLAAVFLGALGEPDPLAPPPAARMSWLARADAGALAEALSADGLHAHVPAPGRISFALSPLLLSHVDAWDAGEAVKARQ